MKKPAFLIQFFGIVVAVLSVSCLASPAPGDDLRIVIIRHAEKPDKGDHLSCQGENRALQLPAVLYQKFNLPERIFVPSMGAGKSTAHARMFETITPFAIKYNQKINSDFDATEYSAIVDHVLHKNGTMLMVWQHEAIPALAAALGVSNPPKWKNKDFDSIWIITYAGGKASLATDKEGLRPSADCGF